MRRVTGPRIQGWAVPLLLASATAPGVAVECGKAAPAGASRLDRLPWPTASPAPLERGDAATAGCRVVPAGNAGYLSPSGRTDEHYATGAAGRGARGRV